MCSWVPSSSRWQGEGRRGREEGSHGVVVGGQGKPAPAAPHVEGDKYTMHCTVQ